MINLLVFVCHVSNFFNSIEMTQSVVSRADLLTNPMHVVVLHESFGKTREDRYMVNIAEALQYSDHFVTVMTGNLNPYDCLLELDVSVKYFL